jgi:predicted acyl esterase
VGDVDFGPAAHWGDAVYNQERLRWFDRWLKDRPTGIADDPPVRIFVMGGGDGRRSAEGHLRHGGAWRSEREWPLARTRYTTFYLQPGGGLSNELPPADALPVRFRHDPERPVPTIGGAVTGFYELVPPTPGMNLAYLTPRAQMRSIVQDGPSHQKEEPGILATRPPHPPLAARSDVLVFQTAPLAEDVEITGPIRVKLWIASSAVDTDFTAKLLDVYPSSVDYPSGYHLNLVDSIIRTRYRDSWEKEELMRPGEVYAVQISLPPTSNLFKAGHRIRLDVASSNFPRFDVNPNTGEPVGRHTHSIVALNTVYLDRARPSQVILPIIPAV